MMSASDLTGEKLAAAVAEKVMGWETILIQGVPIYTPRGGNSSKVVRADTFRPDLNIAQAWEVVRALPDNWDVRNTFIHELLQLTLGFEVGLDTAPDVLGLKTFCIKPISRMFWSFLNATPEQLCRAALAAMESASA